MQAPSRLKAFLLLDLPDLARENVIRSMDFVDLLLLSTLSKKMFQLIRNVKMTLKKFHIRIEDGKMDIDVNNIQFQTFRLFSYSTGRHRFDPCDPRNIRMAGLPLKFFTCFRHFIVNVPDGMTQQQVWKRIVKYLQRLFIIEKYQTTVVEVPIPTLFFWECTRQLDFFEFVDGSRLLTLADLQFILNHLQIAFVKISDKVDQEVGNNTYRNALTNDSVVLFNPFWLHFDAILNSTSPQISIRNSSTPPIDADINTFLKKWNDGELNNVKFFQFILAATSPNVFASEEYRTNALMDLETVPHEQENE